MGAKVTLLHVADPDAVESAKIFLSDWAASHRLEDAELVVETGDVETVIGEYGHDASLVIIGATERGLLSRIIRGSLVFDTIERLETPVLLTERPSTRSLWDRLFGRR